LSGHSGFIQVDIDFKENEHLFNTLATDIETLADKLKYILSFNPYIFYAGLSVSGAGLWLLMPVSNEGDHRATYFKIKAAFDAMEIYVDEQAGQNPNDLRLLSYDPHPLINPNAKVFQAVKEQPKPKPAPAPRQPSKPPQNFDADKVLDKIRNANEGERHGQILKASHLMGGYVASGAIGYDDAYELLEIEGNNIKNSPSEVARTVRDGLERGMQYPIQHKQPQPKPDPKPSPQPKPKPSPEPEPEPAATFRKMANKNPKLNDLADRFQLDIENAEKSEK
jgi:outer membrane biosynthesis protein TonB